MNSVRMAAAAVLLIATALSAHSQGVARTVEMQVDGLVCAFCAQGIGKRLGKESSIEDVVVDLERGIVAVALREGRDIDDETLRRCLEESGFALRHIRRTPETLADLRTRLDRAR